MKPNGMEFSGPWSRKRFYTNEIITFTSISLYLRLKYLCIIKNKKANAVDTLDWFPFKFTHSRSIVKLQQSLSQILSFNAVSFKQCFLLQTNEFLDVYEYGESMT